MIFETDSQFTNPTALPHAVGPGGEVPSIASPPLIPVIHESLSNRGENADGEACQGDVADGNLPKAQDGCSQSEPECCDTGERSRHDGRSDGTGGQTTASLSPPFGDRGWHLTKHVCEDCFGRLLTRSINGVREFICSNCERTGSRLFCACNARFSDVRRGPGKRVGSIMGLRCVKNPNKGQGNLSAYVAAESKVPPRKQRPAERAAARPARPKPAAAPATQFTFWAGENQCSE